MGYLLSIVVPTKDRYEYLFQLIELIKGFKSDDIELIIQDNTDDNTPILEYLNDYSYEHLKYFHTKEQIPISDNSTKAILNSTGEYVCFIGDDDGVCPNITNCVKWMKSNDVEAVISSDAAYDWPESGVGISALDMSGMSSYKKFSGRIVLRNPMKVLIDLAQRGFVDRGELPLVYHGIVKRETLDKIYSKTGSYFPGPSPDIANGVALSVVLNKYAFVDFPIVISGASATHGGGIKKMKNRAADIDSLPFLPPMAKENWEINIPRIWTGETVWCESAIKALRSMGREDVISICDFEYMYARFSAFHFPIRSYAFSLTKDRTKLAFTMWYLIIKRCVMAIYRLVSLRFGKIPGDRIVAKGHSNIHEAVSFFMSINYFSFDKKI